MRRGFANENGCLITMALRLGATVPDVDAALAILGDGSIASRLIEQHVAPDKISAYAERFPSAVLRYVGRTQCDELASLALLIMDRMLTEPFGYAYFRGYEQDQMIGLGFWTLGRLGRRDDIVRLECADGERRREALPNFSATPAIPEQELRNS